jgi:hypothetical protein
MKQLPGRAMHAALDIRSVVDCLLRFFAIVVAAQGALAAPTDLDQSGEAQTRVFACVPEE